MDRHANKKQAFIRRKIPNPALQYVTSRSRLGQQFIFNMDFNKQDDYFFYQLKRAP